MTCYRVGRKVGRTVYRQLGPEPSDAAATTGQFYWAGLDEPPAQVMELDRPTH